jgi:hypothetical protein
MNEVATNLSASHPAVTHKGVFRSLDTHFATADVRNLGLPKPSLGGKKNTLEEPGYKAGLHPKTPKKPGPGYNMHGN